MKVSNPKVLSQHNVSSLPTLPKFLSEGNLKIDSEPRDTNISSPRTKDEI